MFDPDYIKRGDYEDREPELDYGAVVATEGDYWLVSDEEGLNDPVQLSEIDSKPGRVRMHFDDPDFDGIQWTDREFDSFRDARLLYGLILETGDWTEPEGSAIPRSVAISGMEAIASYLRVRYDYSRSRIATELDVSKQTVSNYWNRTRWTPEENQ